MGLVDVEYEAYKCPHCKGVIVVRKQFPVREVGSCSISLEHLDKLPDYLLGEEIKELEESKS